MKLIGMISRFALIHKKAQKQKVAEKLNNFEKFERKKKSALFLTHKPPDDWLDALTTWKLSETVGHHLLTYDVISGEVNVVHFNAC